MNRGIITFCLAASLAVAVTPAGAAFTVVNPASGSELNLEGAGGILDILYGWGNVTRIDDSFDQIWWEWNGGAVARAKYAGDNHLIGYTQGVAGGVPTLSATSGSGFGVVGSFLFNFTPNDNLRFNLKDLRTGDVWSSRVAENFLAEDHMVSYLINAGQSVGNYVIAWEDLPSTAPTSDFDYNDMVIEVNHVHPVPEPTALVLLGLGFGVAGAIGVARRRKIS